MKQNKLDGKVFYTLDTYQSNRTFKNNGNYHHPVISIFLSSNYCRFSDDSKDGEVQAGTLMFTITGQNERHDSGRVSNRTYGCDLKIHCSYNWYDEALQMLREIKRQDSNDIITDTMRWLRKKNAVRITRAEGNRGLYVNVPYKHRKHAAAYLDAVKSGLIKKIA